MMSNVLVVELNDFNSFVVSGEMSYNEFNNLPVRLKIDTGCNCSVINFKCIEYDADHYLMYKKMDIESQTPYTVSYGVETGSNIPKSPKTVDELVKSSAVKFRHDISNVYFGDYFIGDLVIHINYDRTGNNLLGMDILRLFDIHMGISQETGRYTLVMVKIDESDKSDYYKEVKKHFGLVTLASEYAKSFRRGITGLFRKG